MAPGFQVVLCAGAPDTPEIGAEMKAAVGAAQARRPGVVWIDKMVSAAEKIELYSHSSVFCCPSIYEPFGIINLEAMACETAVVATAVGGIKEVVVHGETGYLVPLEQMKESPFEAMHPAQFASDLAARINELMADAGLRERMAKAGRLRAEEHFGWQAIAQRTVELYRTVVRH
jgi:glycosyltransferase involved in cell wall biosynthesis